MLDPADAELIDRACALIAQRYQPDRHHVGASLRTRSGQIYTAVHLEAYVGRVAVCAEAIALGMAAAEGDTEVEVVVAVDRHGRVVTPCGMCRELLSDYAPSCQVIVEEGEVVAISALLPQKYRRQE